MLKRGFDMFVSIILLLLLGVPILLLWVMCSVDTATNGIFIQNRVGQHGKIFKIYKLRTIRDNDQRISGLGAFLRKYNVYEFPQIWNVLLGDMSFVGPRPALFNQDDLIALRTQNDVHELVPGLTGWAQVNGRDELPIPQKVQFDVEYLQRRSLAFDLKILWLTAMKVLIRDGVSH